MKILLFMHLPKTGGITIHNLLVNFFDESKVCKERHNKLHLLNKEEIEFYSFFSGHYDISAIKKYIPNSKQIITILREPKKRILSAYYFAKSHRKDFIDNFPEFSNSPYCYNYHGMNRAAKENNLKDYLYNEKKYLKEKMTRLIGADVKENEDISNRAKKNLEGFKFVGIMKEMETTISSLFLELGLPPPQTTPKYLAFERLHQEYSHCEKIEKEELTLEIEELLEEITNTDMKLYQFEKQIFNKCIIKYEIVENYK